MNRPKYGAFMDDTELDPRTTWRPRILDRVLFKAGIGCQSCLKSAPPRELGSLPGIIIGYLPHPETLAQDKYHTKGHYFLVKFEYTIFDMEDKIVFEVVAATYDELRLQPRDYVFDPTRQG